MSMRIKLDISIYLLNIEVLGYIIGGEDLSGVELDEDVMKAVILVIDLDDNNAPLGMDLDGVQCAVTVLGLLVQLDLHDDQPELELQVFLPVAVHRLHLPSPHG